MNREDKLRKKTSTPSGGKEPTHFSKQPLSLSSSEGAVASYVEHDMTGLGKKLWNRSAGCSFPYCHGNQEREHLHLQGHCKRKVDTSRATA